MIRPMADFEAVDRDLAALASAVPDVRALIERYGERDLRLSNVDAVLATLGEAGVIVDDLLGLGPGVYRVQPFLATSEGDSGGGIALMSRPSAAQSSPPAFIQ